jgi:hypothetical protein
MLEIEGTIVSKFTQPKTKNQWGMLQLIFFVDHVIYKFSKFYYNRNKFIPIFSLIM